MTAATSSTPAERVAFIGGGISCLAAAHVWKRCGYVVQIFEASDRIGGQWTQAYPNVRLQNTAPQYQFAEYPWPASPPCPDRHPTAERIVKYMDQFVKAMDLPVRLSAVVTRMERGKQGEDEEKKRGWTLTIGDQEKEHFDYVIIGTGQFPGKDKKHMPAFPGMDTFKGQIVRSIDSECIMDGKNVAVIGFGKTALDFATMSATRAKKTTHIFRQPRWTIPEYLLGIDFTLPLFSRLGTELMPSWHHSWSVQRYLHRSLSFIVTTFWRLICVLFWYQHVRDAKLKREEDPKKNEALISYKPPNDQFVPDFRSAAALAPQRFYEFVAHGLIVPEHADVSRFTETGIVLANGHHVEADLVCVCCGNDAPTYPFFPAKYRAILENDKGGGPCLYRFAIDPRIPDVGFCGINSFLHLGVLHLAQLWLVAVRRGDLVLPSEADMLAEAACVGAWKKRRVSFEPTSNLSINTRFQQMADLYCNDLGLPMFRKSNILKEVFERYDPTDYRSAIDEYLAKSPYAKPRTLEAMTCVVEESKRVDA